MRKKMFRVGAFLISLSIVFLLLGVIPGRSVLNSNTVIDTSFAVEPGEKREPYEEGTYHHTTLWANPLLKGIVSVEGEGIYLTINEEGRPIYTHVHIDHQYNFTINTGASQQILFIFDNTEGNTTSFVNFLLKEEYTESISAMGMIFGGPLSFFLWYGSFPLALVGLILLIISFFKSNTRKGYKTRIHDK